MDIVLVLVRRMRSGRDADNDAPEFQPDHVRVCSKVQLDKLELVNVDSSEMFKFLTLSSGKILSYYLFSLRRKQRIPTTESRQRLHQVAGIYRLSGRLSRRER